MRTLCLLALVLICTPFASKAMAEPVPLWFNSGMNNRDISFSPPGDVVLTTIVSPKNLFSAIAVSFRRDGKWSELEIAPFSGKYQDIEAFFTPDGSQVLFASKRPKPDREGDDWDLWRVSYSKGDFGMPEALPSVINSTGDEFYPSQANNGNLYFTATRNKETREDIYRAVMEDGEYTRIERLGDGVNSSTWEFNAFIDPDERYLIFGSQRREGEIGGGDLYISYRQSGKFQEAQILPDSVNTKRLGYCPLVFDNRFYFTSERTTPIGSSIKNSFKSSKTNSPLNMKKLTAQFTSPGNGLGDVYSIPLSEITNP